MSGFDFSSAPGRLIGNGSFQSALTDAAILKWSANQLFGTDATTKAVKAQTAMQKQQFMYERGVNTVNALASNLINALKIVESYLKESESQVDSMYTFDFLWDMYSDCIAAADSYHTQIVALLGRGDFRKADKMHDETYPTLVSKIQTLEQYCILFREVSVSLQSAWNAAARIFKDQDILNQLKEYPRLWEELVAEYSRHATSGTWESGFVFESEKLADFSPEMESTRVKAMKCLTLWDDGNEALNQYAKIEELAWDDSTQFNNISSENRQAMTDSFQEVEKCQSDFIPLYDEVNKEFENLLRKIQLLNASIDMQVTSEDATPAKNVDALVKLADLLERGAITQEEFQSQKRKLL